MMNFFFGGRNSNTPGGNNTGSTRQQQQQQQQAPPFFFSPQAFQEFAQQHQANGGNQEGGIAGIFDAFQMAAAQAASMNEGQGGDRNAGAPPASRKTIRQLPTVVVTPEDLVDETNRECCICLEENKLGTKVTRLPCGHIFHPHCINEWLIKHCTCPVCRYELPTEDSSYERGRKQRMARRKPRFAKYELQRMSMTELDELCRTIRLEKKASKGFFSVCSRKGRRGSNDSGSNRGGLNGQDSFLDMDKEDLIDIIMTSGKIDVIAAPEPVEYDCIDDLRSMGVGKLKKAMAAAGVFFDAKDVVEKEDMVQIFLNSGRIVLANPEDTEQKMDYGYTNNYESSSSNTPYSNSNAQSLKSTARYDDEDSADGSDIKRVRLNSEMEDKSSNHSFEMNSNHEAENHEDNGSSLQKDDDIMESNDDEDQSITEQSENHDENQSQVSLPENIISTSSHHNEYNDISSSNESSRFLNRTVGELKLLAQEIGVDLSGCLEKKEMVDRIVSQFKTRDD